MAQVTVVRMQIDITNSNQQRCRYSNDNKNKNKNRRLSLSTTRQNQQERETQLGGVFIDMLVHTIFSGIETMIRWGSSWGNDPLIWQTALFNLDRWLICRSYPIQCITQGRGEHEPSLNIIYHHEQLITHQLSINQLSLTVCEPSIDHHSQLVNHPQPSSVTMTMLSKRKHRNNTRSVFKLCHRHPSEIHVVAGSGRGAFQLVVAFWQIVTWDGLNVCVCVNHWEPKGMAGMPGPRGSRKWRPLIQRWVRRCWNHMSWTTVNHHKPPSSKAISKGHH